MEIVITEKDIDINLNKVVAIATRFNLLPTKPIEIEGFMVGAKAIAIAICTGNHVLVISACDYLLEWRGIQCDSVTYKLFVAEIYQILKDYLHRVEKNNELLETINREDIKDFSKNTFQEV